MIKEHVRHVVTVHGDKPEYKGNESYYNSIVSTAQDLSEEQGIPFSATPRLGESSSALIDLACPEKEFADQLAQRLRDTHKYKQVEVRTETVKMHIPHQIYKRLSGAFGG